MIGGTVHDYSKILHTHPGGAKVLRKYVGIDATKIFHGSLQRSEEEINTMLIETPDKRISMAVKRNSSFAKRENTTQHRHTRLANYILHSLAIGLVKAEPDSQTFDSLFEDFTKPLSRPLRTNQFVYLKLLKRKQITSTARPVILLEFKFQNENDTLVVRPGEHLQLQYVADDDQLITRSYTPIKCRNKGSVEFLVRLYDGQMTSHLKECCLIRMRGPIPSQSILCGITENQCWSNIGMICAGTGITPMLQLIDYHIQFAAKEDNGIPSVQMHLLSINHSSQDIFANDFTRILENQARGTLQVTNLVQKAPPGWTEGLVGDISTDIIAAVMPIPAKHDAELTCIVVCGPPMFNANVMELLTKEKVYDKRMIRVL